MSKVINKYPKWVEKYRSKGITIRKTTNGYGLYKCTSIYDPSKPYPVSKQEFLGMVYEDKGFIAKANKVNNNPVYVEYGLSSFIMLNFKRELKRASYDGNEDIIKLGIIKYIFDSYNEVFIKSSYLTTQEADHLIEYSYKISDKRINTVAKRVDELFHNKINDKDDLNVLINMLKLAVIDINTDIKPIINNQTIIDISNKYKLKLWPKE